MLDANNEALHTKYCVQPEGSKLETVRDGDKSD